MLGRAPGAPRLFAEGARADCEVGADLTGACGSRRTCAAPSSTASSASTAAARPPAGPATEVAEAARFAAVGYAAVMFDAVGGAARRAAETVARWSGRALDPAIAAIFAEAPAELLTLASPDDLWAAVVEAEPAPRRRSATRPRSTRRWPGSATPPT